MAYLEIGGQRHIVPPGEVSIGSDPSCDIPLTGAGVSPRHAIVHGADDGQAVIRKASEKLEVMVNGVRLGPQPTPLLHGDKVQIAEFELRFVDERRSGSTQFVKAVNPGQAGAKPGKKSLPTGTTGGRVVSLTDGREYAIAGQSLVVGRDAGCDVVITGKNVSRRHAEIMGTPKGYLVVDSSTNGTFVNGERVQRQRLLARADVIRIGDDEFRYYADAAAEGSAPVPSAPAPAPPPPPPPSAPEGGRLANTLFGVKSVPRDAAASSAATIRPTAPPPPATPAASPAGTIPPSGGRTSQAGPLATLVARGDTFKGQRFPIKVPVVNIGRADYNDIILNHDSVSTVHAKLQRREGVWVIVDLDSTNGTFVDGERISGEAPLLPGALLRFGGVGMMFETTDDAIDSARGSSTKMLQAIKIPPKPGGAA
jgi:pSer/pThr/pTyr-binding forkhead associated (FHA) protein